jgi:hypothetical protein
MATENGHRSLELKKDSHIVHSSNLELDVTCCYNISTPGKPTKKKNALDQ